MRSTVDRARGSSVRHLLVLTGLLALLFAALTGLVVAGATEAFDQRVSAALTDRQHPWLILMTQRLSATARPLLALLLIPFIASLLRRRTRFGLVLLGSGLGSVALNLATRVLLRRDPPGYGANPPVDWRAPPLRVLLQVSDHYSYPSGHFQTALVILGLLLIWCWPSLPVAARLVLFVGASAYLVALAYGRVVLGHHFPSDVLGGALLGGAWLAATGLLLSVPPVPFQATTSRQESR